MEDRISLAKAEFLRAKERLTHALATTPDDKINWSPSPTARTPIQVVAHASLSITGIRDMLAGKPFPFANKQEVDAFWRNSEKEFTTREEVLSLLEKGSADFLAWLDALTSEQVDSQVEMPFGMVQPMDIGITIPADHLRGHAAQIDYIQTIYGDRDIHIPL